MAPDFVLDSADVPATKPAFDSFYADRSGRVWVVTEGPERPDRECTEADRAAGVALMIGTSGAADVRMTGGEPREISEGCWARTCRFDLFDLESGEYLGSVPAPGPGFRTPLFASGTTVLASVTDELGTVRLKKYRLQID